MTAQAAPTPGPAQPSQRVLDNGAPAGVRRWLLWGLLAGLLAALMGTLVWLTGRYELGQQQTQLEEDAAAMVSDIRSGLNRHVQSLQSLQAGDPSPQGWSFEASALLREHRELVRIEWRDGRLALLAGADSPYWREPFARIGRDSVLGEVGIACATSSRLSGPAYANSYYLPQLDGLGMEVMDLCLPLIRDGLPAGYVVATYALPDVLAEMLPRDLLRTQQVSFTEADGTRLAMVGEGQRRGGLLQAQQLLDLPGHTLVLRLDRWIGTPGLLPNVLTALVATMSLALAVVLALLVRDSRRRLRAERGLAEALAFRKAMEDSLVTGLRARDLQGRVTYVNPAFCAMVGFSAEELMQPHDTQPYWPPEMAAEYQSRLVNRLAGTAPPRTGFESVFMRRDGTRFPVLVIEAPLINAGGIQTGWMSAFLDISEQRRVEELSRASQERLQATARLATVGEMASLLSHELNQPLAAISSYATGSLNLLAQDALPAHALRQAMQGIAAQAERAGKVIRSVHDFVRRRDQQREAVTPQALLDAVMPLIVLQARKLHVRVLVDVAPDVPTVWCDRTMVEQVLLNLARNGMQAMDQVPIASRDLRLEVRLRGPTAASGESRPAALDDAAAMPWVEFLVSDGGLGITPEVAQRIFTPFFTTKAQGMGLGLSLCRTVVEQHGGALVYEPRQTQGTVFRFTLPAAPG